jgi:multicomponent Na+:H+ antiporter subunit B
LRLWQSLGLAAAAALLLLATASLPPLRDPASPIASHVDAYYLRHAYRDNATPNVVTAVLADYRSYDTFGETTVILAAGLSVYLLLRRARR